MAEPNLDSTMEQDALLQARMDRLVAMASPTAENEEPSNHPTSSSSLSGGYVATPSYPNQAPLSTNSSADISKPKSKSAGSAPSSSKLRPLSSDETLELRIYFREYDANGDDYISVGEMKHLLTRLQYSYSDEYLSQLFQITLTSRGRIAAAGDPAAGQAALHQAVMKGLDIDSYFLFMQIFLTLHDQVKRAIQSTFIPPPTSFTLSGITNISSRILSQRNVLTTAMMFHMCLISWNYYLPFFPISPQRSFTK